MYQYNFYSNAQYHVSNLSNFFKTCLRDIFVILRKKIYITTFILTYVVELNVICRLSMCLDENWYT